MKAPAGPSGVPPNAPQLPRRQLGKERKPGGSKKPRKAASVGSSPAWTDSPCYHTHPRRSPRLTPLHNALARTTLSPGAALSSAPSLWKQRGGSAVPAAAPFAEAARVGRGSTSSSSAAAAAAPAPDAPPAPLFLAHAQTLADIAPLLRAGPALGVGPPSIRRRSTAPTLMPSTRRSVSSTSLSASDTSKE